MSKGEQDLLNPKGINAIRFMNGAIRIWGARTLSTDPSWRSASPAPAPPAASMIVIMPAAATTRFALVPATTTSIEGKMGRRAVLRTDDRGIAPARRKSSRRPRPVARAPWRKLAEQRQGRYLGAQH